MFCFSSSVLLYITEAMKCLWKTKGYSQLRKNARARQTETTAASGEWEHGRSACAVFLPGSTATRLHLRLYLLSHSRGNAFCRASRSSESTEGSRSWRPAHVSEVRR